ncbi:OVARIAN TUMOR DOMAIN-containing deubiquitinating enzyme 9-like isoform X3 [Diospyros lotus]|uniref:OVARIAN TUMOR DOMAIN-containing deubiquitinating enzyme 9-like isoform X3 n=1 Tax=Diospyros lotus TaxID=55363 RepID=UPI00225176F8|nr:OVARIAN TUMOR DOMAIN-containing deubiquitinating enzyme 9-like isoform X3 [Diospyros lotus]
MIIYEQDPDVVPWGLHLLDVCQISTGSSPCSTIHFEKDLSQLEYVQEGYCETKCNEVENDEIIACAFQEELSRLAAAELSGSSQEEHLQACILAQDWKSRSYGDCNFGTGEKPELGKSLEGAYEWGKSTSFSSAEENSLGPQDCSPEMADESTLDGEVGKRLNQMIPVPHIPKINGEMPSADEETSDHQRLLDRLQVYDLVELKVKGDGNCQFRALSDQIYRSAEHHQFVRQEVVDQLRLHPELYEGYVPMAYGDYLKHISRIGEWGDHVTLQAAADAYGVKIFIITSFKDTCYVEILPHVQKSKRSDVILHFLDQHTEESKIKTENKAKKKGEKNLESTKGADGHTYKENEIKAPQHLINDSY